MWIIPTPEVTTMEIWLCLGLMIPMITSDLALRLAGTWLHSTLQHTLCGSIEDIIGENETINS
jgi:hypothetical protein